MDMKMFAGAVAITAAMAQPAMAETYLCRSAAGAEVAVQVELDGNRLAMHDGKTLKILCGEGGDAQCPRMVDKGYTSISDYGIILFLPASQTFTKKAWGDERATEFACRADARVRKRFG